MGAVKELYFALMEKRMEDLIEQGMDEQEAYDTASDRAYHDLGDHMADIADNMRMRAKEGK
jgi:hypothetical protein